MTDSIALFVQAHNGKPFAKPFTDSTSIGRGVDNDLPISHKTVSRKHAHMHHIDGTFILEDLNSTSGTYVNAERIKRVPVGHGDVLCFGKLQGKFMINPIWLKRQPLVEQLLYEVVDRSATDLMLKHGQSPRLMISREYENSTNHPNMITDKILQKTLLHLFPDEFDSEASEFTAIVNTGFGERFRLHAYRQQGKWSLLFRHVRRRPPTINELHLPDACHKATEFKDGIILLTGAPNSGKTTTLAAMLEAINRTRKGRILTLEDPVEFRFQEDLCVIDQIEVGIDVANWDDARKSLVRQNPEIVFIGELRDAETVETALQAAASGQLVFATLHTLDISQLLPRIMQLIPSDESGRVLATLSQHLKAVFCQKLIPCDRMGTTVIPVMEHLVLDPGAKMIVERGLGADLADYVRGHPNIGQDFNGELSRLIDDDWINEEQAMSHSPNEERLRMLRMGVELNEDKGYLGDRRRDH